MRPRSRAWVEAASRRSPRAHRATTCCLLLLALGMVAAPASAQEAETADGKVEAGLDAGVDRKIEARLAETYASLESLAGIEVTVNAGLVKLEGEVLSSEARKLAGALARQIEGVTAVENEIVETRSLRRRMAALRGELEDRAWRVVQSIPLFGVALFVLAIFVFVARVLGRRERLFAWLTPNVFLQDLARQAGQGALLLTGFLLVLEILDATALIGAVLGAAGLVGLAIGFAFRDLVENYIASILLSLRQPFSPNDHVIIAGHEGKVVRLTSRATILLSFDGNHIRLPNAMVFKSVIENFSRKHERRFQFVVGVGVDERLTRAQDLAVSVLAGIEGVLADPPPFVLVDTLADSSVALRVFGWIDQRASDFGRVRSEAIRLVKNAFDAEGIEMPEPIVRVRTERVEAEAHRATSPSDRGRAEAPGEPADTSLDAISTPRDVAPDHHLDLEIAAERASEEPDLLDPEAPVE